MQFSSETHALLPLMSVNKIPKQGTFGEPKDKAVGRKAEPLCQDSLWGLDDP